MAPAGLFLSLVLSLVLGGAAAADAPAEEPEPPPLVLFWGDGCPHCAAEAEFLLELQSEYPDLEIYAYEVWHDEGNRALFVSVMAERGEDISGVPTTLFGDQTWVGYNDAQGEQIRSAVAAVFAEDVPPPEESGVMDLPLLGQVEAASASLVVGTLVIGFVDGFNPCSLWALSILLALVLRTGSRRRVLAVGTTFLLVTAGLYGLYIAGLYGALELAAHASWIRTLMALVALAFGLVNVKDFFAFRRGITLSIPDRSKPGLYRRMRSVALSDRPLPAVLAGTVVLATGVSLLETPCTAGYPLLWADLLSSHEAAATTAVALFGLYMLVFLIDEFAVFGVAVVAMRASRLEERHGQVLKLISGMVMVVLAVVLVAAPRLMESVAGAMLTFAIAAVATLLVLGFDRMRARVDH